MLKRIATVTAAIGLVCLFGGFAVPAWADTGFYLGGEIGRSSFDGTEIVPAGDDDRVTGVDVAWQVFGGYQILEWLGVEAGFIDFGAGHDHDVDQEEFALDGMTLSAIGYIPIGLRFAVMIRGGVYSWDYVETDSRGDEEADGTDLIVGLGGDVKVMDSLSVRFEWTFLSDVGESGGRLPGEADVTGLFAGVSYNF
jgi:OOP family OmpA-OmpF porin